MEREIIEIFKKLNDAEINYFILRDFKTIERICNTLDIDIYASKRQKKNIDLILRKNNWHTSRINDNKYPHKQYCKIISGKLYKLDIVYGLAYGKQNLVLREKLNLQQNNYVGNIKVATGKTALKTMLLHIIFDKEQLSEKNYNVLLDIYKMSSKDSDDIFSSIATEILKNEIRKTNANIQKYKKLLRPLLKCYYINNFFITIRIKTASILKKIYTHMTKRSIAITGVDGAGKSTAINYVKKIYGDRSAIVYMGEKSFRSKHLEKLLKQPKLNLAQKTLKTFLYANEQFYRYYKYRFTDKIVLFDRYVDDIFINSGQKGKPINTILYNFLFPEPSIKFYLYCNVKTSFSRKDDIIDKDQFIKMKKRFDDYYLAKKQTVSICTDAADENDVIRLISDRINSNFKKSLF